MLFLVDAVPNHCPQCGTDLTRSWQDPLSRQEIFSKVAQVCRCGSKWQMVDRETLLNAANADGGDLRCNADE
ncbi:hypothetical protein [Pseudomonas sp. MWU12-2323]|uniref:hypothetical protein n=1 Tax=Pseudomonas sp. MWU12-2323 TaxID=2651296 RepID=UPI00128CCD86|nr:hypothetical protein [Pseudomonas sp. MWU12-2323]MPQ69477.1 hypothetical protein [Pseudomonas sp. MWU12-2323]